MPRAILTSVVLFFAPFALVAQQSPPVVPHDSVRGAIRAVDVRAHTLEVTTGVGFALRVVRLQVPATVPITDRKAGQGAPHEAAKTQDRSEALRVEALALFAAQHVPHEQHVRHATENGVYEDCGLRCRHVRPNKRTVAAPRRSRLRYQKSTRRTMRTGPGRSIVRLQEP